MAALFTHVLRRSRRQIVPFTGMLLSHTEEQILPQGRRYLFSSEILGLDSYERQRVITSDRLGELKDKFRSRMEEYMNGEIRGTIFTDDLKNMLHVTETQDDIGTTEKMLRRYNSQSKELQFSQFMFGPVIFRLLYTLHKPDLAYQLFMDPELDGMFDQMSSFLILSDQLYENGEYNKVLDVFEVIHKKKLKGYRYPNDVTTVAMAACYKLNSQESFNKMMEIAQGCKEAGVNLSNRSLYFSAFLALHQNRPEIALEILSVRDDARLNIIVNLQAIAFAKVGRFQDSFQILKNVLQRDLPDSLRRGNEIYKDTISEIQTASKQADESEWSRQFDSLRQGLLSGGHIADNNLEDFINQPIIRPRQMQSSFKSRMRTPHPDQYQNRFEPRIRAGLADMD